jgi:hypothetical protein
MIWDNDAAAGYSAALAQIHVHNEYLDFSL